MSLTDLELDGISLADAVPEAVVLRVERPLVGSRRHETVDVPGRAGSWIFPEEPGDRTLEIPLDIQGADFADRRDAVRRLADWCDLGRVAPLIISDEPDRYHDAILDNDSDGSEWLVRAEPVLRFLVAPYALALEPTEVEFEIVDGHYEGTLNLPDDVAAEPIIEVDPDGNGYIAGFALTVNDDTLQVFGPNDAFPVDEIVTVSSISDTVTVGANVDVNLTGAYDPAGLAMAQVSGRFPMLVPGDNEIEINMEATADPAILRIIWRRRFR